MKKFEEIIETGMKNFLKEIILIFMGTAIAGLGMGSFLLPNKISSGGFAGIATIFYYFFDWNVGFTVIVMNIPFLFLAFMKIGKKFLVKTILGTLSLSFFIDFFERFALATNDRLLSCIYGGVLVGIGTALIFKARTSTGGSDLIVQFAKASGVRISSSRLLNLIDISVVVLNVIFFKEIEIGLYSAIAIFLDGIMIDNIFEGINFSKMVFIISDKSDEVLSSLYSEVNCGVTELYGKGAFMKRDKVVLMTVVNRREIPALREVVYRIDGGAFIVVTNAREVYGDGFKEIDKF